MMTRKQRIIRALRQTDVAALMSLIERTVDTCYASHYCPEAVQFFKDYHNEQAILKDARACDIIVLVESGQIIGTGTLAGDEIKRVFVDPAAHGQGCGRVIMRRLEEKAAEKGVTRVKLDASLPSKAFYDKLGYVTVEKAFRSLATGRLEFFKMQRSIG